MDIFTKMMDELKIEGHEIHLHKIILSPVKNLLKGDSDELDQYQASIESDHTVDSFQDLARELDKLYIYLINATACLWQFILINEKIMISSERTVDEKERYLTVLPVRATQWIALLPRKVTQN